MAEIEKYTLQINSDLSEFHKTLLAASKTLNELNKSLQQLSTNINKNMEEQAKSIKRVNTNLKEVQKSSHGFFSWLLHSIKSTSMALVAGGGLVYGIRAMTVGFTGATREAKELLKVVSAITGAGGMAAWMGGDVRRARELWAGSRLSRLVGGALAPLSGARAGFMGISLKDLAAQDPGLVGTRKYTKKELGDIMLEKFKVADIRKLEKGPEAEYLNQLMKERILTGAEPAGYAFGKKIREKIGGTTGFIQGRVEKGREAAAGIGAAASPETWYGKFIHNLTGTEHAALGASKAVSSLGKQVAVAAVGFEALNKITGSSILTMGLLTAGLGILIVVFQALIYAVGNFVQGVGLQLLGRGKQYAEVFGEAEGSLFRFKTSLQGLTKQMGSETVGTFEDWSEWIDKFSFSIKRSQPEIYESSGLMLEMASSLKFNKAEMQKLLQVSADYAAQNREDLLPTVQTLTNAIYGYSASARVFGINLSEAELQQSEFAKATGKTWEAMTFEERARVRLNVLFKQAQTIEGSSIQRVNTLKGATDAYNAALVNLYTTMGKGAETTITPYYKMLANLTNQLNALPKPVLQAVGSIEAMAGSVLYVIGAFVKLSVTLLGITYAIKGFSQLHSLFNWIFKTWKINVYALIEGLTGARLAGKGFFMMILSLGIGSMTMFLKTIGGLLQSLNIMIGTTLTGKTTFASLGATISGPVVAAFKSLNATLGITTGLMAALGLGTTAAPAVAAGTYIGQKVGTKALVKGGPVSGLVGSILGIFGGKKIVEELKQGELSFKKVKVASKKLSQEVMDFDVRKMEMGGQMNLPVVGGFWSPRGGKRESLERAIKEGKSPLIQGGLLGIPKAGPLPQMTLPGMDKIAESSKSVGIFEKVVQRFSGVIVGVGSVLINFLSIFGKLLFFFGRLTVVGLALSVIVVGFYKFIKVLTDSASPMETATKSMKALGNVAMWLGETVSPIFAALTDTMAKGILAFTLVAVKILGVITDMEGVEQRVTNMINKLKPVGAEEMSKIGPKSKVKILAGGIYAGELDLPKLKEKSEAERMKAIEAQFGLQSDKDMEVVYQKQQIALEDMKRLGHLYTQTSSAIKKQRAEDVISRYVTTDYYDPIKMGTELKAAKEGAKEIEKIDTEQRKRKYEILYSSAKEHLALISSLEINPLKKLWQNYYIEIEDLREKFTGREAEVATFISQKYKEALLATLSTLTDVSEQIAGIMDDTFGQITADFERTVLQIKELANQGLLAEFGVTEAELVGKALERAIKQYREILRAAQKDIAQITGNIKAMIELETEERLEKLKEAQEKGLISEQQYANAVKAINQKKLDDIYEAELDMRRKLSSAQYRYLTAIEEARTKASKEQIEEFEKRTGQKLPSTGYITGEKRRLGGEMALQEVEASLFGLQKTKREEESFNVPSEVGQFIAGRENDLSNRLNSVYSIITSFVDNLSGANESLDTLTQMAYRAAQVLGSISSQGALPSVPQGQILINGKDYSRPSSSGTITPGGKDYSRENFSPKTKEDYDASRRLLKEIRDAVKEGNREPKDTFSANRFFVPSY